jgi:hypothetical protein
VIEDDGAGLEAHATQEPEPVLSREEALERLVVLDANPVAVADQVRVVGISVVVRCVVV